ncbi:alpha/beta hydrolase [Robertmurraya kyonggiensis]|uniref:Phospholipase n=1 Tax=Robertmurraya kyonggiensis TaxID=1037680 RepID=A0A4U1D3M6_9BACI|nr:phospholipase [Robertmurraya kyonggiensis]TKC16408.1 phospholipase [Robertmurraya kyonggiensis]
MNVHLQEEITYYGAAFSEAKAFVLSLHGRSQSPETILEIAERIGLEGIYYAAPKAYQNSWYPEKFMAPLEKNEPFLTYSLEVCSSIVNRWIEKGVPAEKIVLLGFSQGACLAAEYSIRTPKRYGGVLLFTGGLIGPEGTNWPIKGNFDGTPVFLGTSDVDEWVPVERVDESEAMFAKMGAKTVKLVFKGMEHLVNDEEIEAARSIIRMILEDERN